MHILSNTGRFLFWFFSIVVSLVSLRILFLEMESSFPNMLHHLPREMVFYGHVIGASIALLLMPFQIWNRLRSKRPVLHRWIGRIYGIAILIGGVSGMLLAPHAGTGVIAATGFFMLSVVWLVATTIGIMAARARNFKKHRVWMLRSMALTFAAVTLRLMLGLSLLLGVPFELAYPVIAWACWTVNLAIQEGWLRYTRRL